MLVRLYKNRGLHKMSPEKIKELHEQYGTTNMYELRRSLLIHNRDLMIQKRDLLIKILARVQQVQAMRLRIQVAMAKKRALHDKHDDDDPTDHFPRAPPCA